MKTALLAALAAVTASSGLSAQRDWASPNPPTVPSAALDFDMVYDAARAQCVLFGGRDGGGVYYGDTWTWDGVNWTQQSPATSPTARTSNRMAFDTTRGVTVLFGGHDQTVGALGDTWTWDGINWTQNAPANSPPPRNSHAMWFDMARQRVMVFGGSGTNGALGDTWAWDGIDWTQTPTASSPPAVFSIHAAYDVLRDRAVLFGGAVPQAGGNLQRSGETWEFDGANWTMVPTTIAPAPRWGAKMAYSFDLQRVVLTGGNTGGFSAETWEWEGFAWHLVSTSTTPPGRDNHCAAYDIGRARVVMFGGYPTRYDTWEYGDPSTGRLAPFGEGCPGSAGTPDLHAVGGVPPGRGANFDLEVTQIPSTTPAVFVLLGFGTLPGIDLGAIGMTGCRAFVDAVIANPTTIGSGTATWSLPVPNDPRLLGARFWTQAVVVDPAGNPLGMVMSNGVEATIG